VKVSGPVTLFDIAARKSTVNSDPRWKNPGGRVMKPDEASVAVALVSMDFAVV